MSPVCTLERHNNSVERTGDAAAEARDNDDAGSKKTLCGSNPRPLSSQPLCCTESRINLMEQNADSPSPLLASYISEVELATGLVASIAPFDDAIPGDELQAALNIGPSYEGIDVRYRPAWSISHPAVEKAVAHELTHALMIYAMGYPVVDASDEVPAEVVKWPPK